MIKVYWILPQCIYLNSSHWFQGMFIGGYISVDILLDREVMASVQLLDMPERVDWKACKPNRQEEETQAEDFRNKFEQFDFTLEWIQQVISFSGKCQNLKICVQ